MDEADKAQVLIEKQGFGRSDPLRGVDVEREYERITAGRSSLSERVQGMVVARYERGE